MSNTINDVVKLINQIALVRFTGNTMNVYVREKAFSPIIGMDAVTIDAEDYVADYLSEEGVRLKNIVEAAYNKGKLTYRRTDIDLTKLTNEELRIIAENAPFPLSSQFELIDELEPVFMDEVVDLNLPNGLCTTNQEYQVFYIK